MPQIPTYTARGDAAVLQTATRVIPKVTAQDLGAAGFAELAETGKDLTKIGNALQRQQDELEAASLVGAWDVRQSDLKKAILNNPDIQSNHETEFVKQSRDLRDEFKDKTQRRTVLHALDMHISRSLPRAYIDVQTDSLKLQGTRQLAELDRLGDIYARRAAEGVPGETEEAIAIYKDMVAGMVSRNFMDADVAQKKMSKFQSQVSFNNADYLRRQALDQERTGVPVTAREELTRRVLNGDYVNVDPINLSKVLERAEKDQERYLTRQATIANEASKLEYQNLGTLANNGLLTSSQEDDLLAGRNVLIQDPDKARHLVNINQNPPSGALSQGVSALEQEYSLAVTRAGGRTVELANKYSEKLDKLARTSDKPSKDVTRFGRILKTDIDRAREIGNSIASEKIKVALAHYRANMSILLPLKFIGPLQANERRLDESKIMDEIYANPNISSTEVADKYIKMQQEKYKAKPKETQTIDKLRQTPTPSRPSAAEPRSGASTIDNLLENR